MDVLNPDHLALPESMKPKPPARNKIKLPRHQIGEKFLKGPIPYLWLCQASQLPGKSLQVAVVIWFLAGLHKSSTIKLTQSVLNDFGVNRHCKYRALKWLAEAQLIAVQGDPGCSPLVTLLDVTRGD